MAQKEEKKAHENEPDKLTEEQKKALEDTQAKEKLNDETNAAAERLEKANETTEKLRTEAAETKTETALGGETEIGAKPPEETPKEYKDRVMAGDVDEQKTQETP